MAHHASTEPEFVNDVELVQRPIFQKQKRVAHHASTEPEFVNDVDGMTVARGAGTETLQRSDSSMDYKHSTEHKQSSWQRSGPAECAERLNSKTIHNGDDGKRDVL